MMRRALVAAALAVWNAAALDARAAGDAAPTSAWAERRVALDVHVGHGTPYGFAGASMGITPIEYATIEAGVGVAADGSGVGRQLGLLARGRYPFGEGGVRRSAVSLGVGTSWGAYVSYGGWDGRGPFGLVGDPLWEKDWSTAYWLRVEASYEHRYASGVQIRLYSGMSGLLNPNAAVCYPHDPHVSDCTDPPPSSERRVLSLGLALGYAFAL